MEAFRANFRAGSAREGFIEYEPSAELALPLKFVTKTIYLSVLPNPLLRPPLVFEISVRAFVRFCAGVLWPRAGSTWSAYARSAQI
jgi:hypothetical protein